MSTLVIIDMQPNFLFSPVYDYIVKGCIKEVINAKKRAADIVLVEYRGCGHTISKITNVIGSYSRSGIVIKPSTDGGNQLVKYLKEKNIPTKSIRFTGVYTNACVYETAATTCRLLPNGKYYLVKNATGCGTSANKNPAINSFKKLNFKII